MKITAVHSYLVSLPLSKPYRIAYMEFTHTEIVIFQISLACGITGVGACSPFVEVVGESPADSLLNLQSPQVQELVGQDIGHFQDLIDRMAGHFSHYPGTLAAIDIALHDAFCRYKEIPIVEFFGRKIDSLPTSFTIGIKDTAEMVEEAKSLVRSGFRILKIKTGIQVEKDIERVEKMMECLGSQITLRVDANQGYSLQELQQFIKQTRHLPIELIEQPLDKTQNDQLLNISDQERRRLVADESLLDAASALSLSRPPRPFGVFNIKLMKCGGIQKALEIARIAQGGNISLFWGCNDESIISISAALHAAYSCTNTRFLDLDGSFDLVRDLASGGFVVKEGRLFTTSQAGLGIQMQDS